MKKDNKQRFSILISVGVHILIFVLLLIGENTLQKPEKQELEIEWVQLNDPKNSPLEDVQIVQQDETINDVTPEKDYKLSKHNQDVHKETVAQKNGEFKNRKSIKEGQKVVQNQKSKKSSSKAKKLDLGSLKPQLFDSSFDQSKLAPNPVSAKSGSEVSQNDDYLKDVVSGAQTLLKTREFVYYSYYNRIKIKLRQHWEPRIKTKIEKIMRKGRRIASTNDKVTRLIITLNTSGDLVRIQVRNASGYNDLDDAAIEAFRAAAPFPNPPQGIVDNSGEVQINWDFVLET